ncbi:MAG: hypothetical protein HUU43_08870 [Ignavibacteriaceae bacterium]|nr:hypothetical protein [Ignavibacteriaceae bacterium]
MKSPLKLLLIILFLLTAKSYSQSLSTGWVEFDQDSVSSYYYDGISAKSINSAKPEIRIRQVYNFAKRLSEVKNERVKTIETLYLINLEDPKYSIKEVAYFDEAGAVLETFKYPSVDEFSKKDIFMFPITEGSLLMNFLRHIADSR